jgi:hypothetical protein
MIEKSKSSKTKKEVTAEPVNLVKESRRVQTAEGWKRSMAKSKKGAK